MKYLVTGAGGFLGNHICEYFDKKNIAYRATVREKKNDHQFSTGDLTQFSDWQNLFKGIDIVIHSAAKAHDMSGHPGLKDIYQEVNLHLTLRLAKEAKKAQVKRFIFISTIKVNGELTDEKSFSADDVPAPTDDYGISKYQAETELLKLHTPGEFEVVIIRPCLIYGRGVKANFQSLIKLVDKAWPLPFASIQNKRSFVSVDNLIDLIHLCATATKASGQIFLVSDDNDLSLPDLIRNIARAAGKKAILVPFPVFIFKILLKLLGKSDLSVRLFSSLQVDIEKTKSLLNWKPPFSVQDSLKQML
ncbi:MAG: NAD-dependent epimerase/dehydratase family protein [Bdellovibrio sp.]|nr:NAD-dependent epimerase/dehydratase family protein [Bdellovibrio sp.]